jgi:signal transduction histidine kinase
MQGYEILINPQSNEVQANTVIIKTHLQSEKIPVNPAILTSLIYNLTKNAGKAIQAYKSRNPGDTKVCKIEIEINEDEKGWNFVVADTGIGLETDALLQQAGTAVRHAAPHELEIYKNISGKRAIKILQDWTSKDKSLQARDLKLGQVWDFAKLPRLSGFDKDGIRESSGFGLYGADHLAKNYGGDIVGANRFGQGAVFVIRIPKSEKLEALAA